MELLGQLGRALVEFPQGGFGALGLRLGLVVLILLLPGALLGCFRLPLGRRRRFPARFLRAPLLADGLAGGVFWLRWRLPRARPGAVDARADVSLIAAVAAVKPAGGERL
ncbi:hypothetical protein [Streptomyces sp. NRRL S-813]|uniref:hypothetical protein n=1 Tax=Streptomyces sp. NRRL S-813 TaxID=1463919 RepID=UPI00099CFC3D|nr:hypothetical protein [Streptomyces sp. NRRL S-813]